MRVIRILATAGAISLSAVSSTATTVWAALPNANPVTAVRDGIASGNPDRGGSAIPDAGWFLGSLWRSAEKPAGSSGDESYVAARTVLGGQSINQFVPIGSSTLWVFTQNDVKPTGGGQDIELTSNAGRTWTDVTPPGLSVDGGERWIASLMALSSTRAWVVYGGSESTSPQFIDTTSDAGRHWSRVGEEPSSGCSIQFVTARDGTCSQLWGAGGSMSIGIYRTVDGGATWRKVFQSGDGTTASAPGSIPFACDKRIDFESASKGWVLFECNAGSGAVIYETTDGGVTWTERHVTPPSSVRAGGGGFTGPPVFVGLAGAVPYSVGNYSAVYATGDGGESFHLVHPPGTPRQWAVDIVSPTIWRLSFGREILATDNAGRYWFTLTSDTVLKSTSDARGSPPGGTVDFTSQSEGWLVENAYSPHSKLLHTTDEGRVWNSIALPGT